VCWHGRAWLSLPYPAPSLLRPWSWVYRHSYSAQFFILTSKAFTTLRTQATLPFYSRRRCERAPLRHLLLAWRLWLQCTIARCPANFIAPLATPNYFSRRPIWRTYLAPFASC